MRSNAGLHHVPGALLAPTSFGQSTYALTRGVAEIFSAEDNSANTVRRIIRLAKQKRRFDRMKRYFSNPQPGMAEDAATSLFTHETLARRLQNHVAIAEASARPLSAAILRLVSSSGSQSEFTGISKHVGQLLRRVLRLEDTAGAFDWRTFAILMPASNEAGARAALTRISAVLETNALQEARSQFPDLRIETNAAEFNPGEPAGAFLVRAASRSGF
jgi:PleD family two-component response regulator